MQSYSGTDRLVLLLRDSDSRVEYFRMFIAVLVE